MSTLELGHSKYSAVRVAPKLTGLTLIATSFQTLGIVYADLGTSPLYTLNGIWPTKGPVPPKEDVIGGVSAIIWAMTLLPLTKYALICLRFGTSEGELAPPCEGGTFALFHGLYPPEHPDIDSARSLTGDSFKEVSSQKAKRNFLSAIRWPLMVWAMFGTSLTMADGVLTPAVSVTSAVTGIAIAKPSVSHDVVPVSIAFLVILFLFQRFGTFKLAVAFAPISFIFLALVGGTGIANITRYPGILRAFDPSRAVMLFVRTGQFDLLAGVLLAVTGCEAMFASLGQFNDLSIQIAFAGFVYPCCLLSYLGQGARLIVDGADVLPNLFYLTIPGSTNGPLYWIIYVFAILATLVASQTLITACFSLVQQVVNMKSLPAFRMTHTSAIMQGQIHVPVVNWTLMILTIAVVAGFGSSTNLTNAFGFAVATVMFTTTILISFQIIFVKHLPIILALAFFCFFGFFDGIFWGAALKKVPHGAWVPLMIGLILCTFMTFWTWAKGLEDTFDGKNRQNLRRFILQHSEKLGSPISARHSGTGTVMPEADDVDNTGNISDDGSEGAISHSEPHLYFLAQVRPKVSIRESQNSLDGEKVGAPASLIQKELPRISSCAVFHKSTYGRGVPHSFVSFIRRWPSLPQVVIFMSVRVLATARVPLQDRYQVSRVRTITGFYGVTYCLGFMDDFLIDVNDVINLICTLEARADPENADTKTNLIREAAQITTHVVPHYHVSSRQVEAGRLSAVLTRVRMFLLEGVYRHIAGMFPETSNWSGSADEIIRIGINAEI